MLTVLHVSERGFYMRGIENGHRVDRLDETLIIQIDTVLQEPSHLLVFSDLN